MNWQQFEKIFNRAFFLSFSKKKLAITFFALILCGCISVLCRALSHNAGQWMQINLVFLPMFLSVAIFFVLGIVLLRLCLYEMKAREISYIKVIKEAYPLFRGIPYVSLPLIFTYLILWILLGFFYLLRAIPSIGPMIGSLFSFAPFMLIIGSLGLVIFQLVLLFFLTPAVAVKSTFRPEFTLKVYERLKGNPCLAVMTFLVGFSPPFILAAFLSLAALITQIMYVDSSHGVSIFLKWLLMMIPFCALLTPGVLFFFHFALESYPLFHKKETAPE